MKRTSSLLQVVTNVWVAVEAVVEVAVWGVCLLGGVILSSFLLQEKEIKANAVKVVVKEIRFGPQTDEHDYNFKLKHARNFLTEGNKVKASVFFRGRSIMFKEQGEDLLKKFIDDLEDIAKVDNAPKLEGKRMIVNLSPKPKK